MRTFLSCAAAAALLAATGCSEQEIPSPAGPGNEGNGEVATLGITTGVKASTKAIVEGGMLTYKTTDYENQPGLGIVMLDSEGNGFYGAKTADQTLEKNHIWFMGDQAGENWKSISAIGTTFAGATTKGFTLLDAVGTVYAYYPKAADEKLSGETVDDLALAVPLQTTGTITFDDKVTNADMKFNSSGSTKWSTNSTGKKIMISNPDETDYLYAYNADRFVNSGRASDGIPAGNADATNPGREIALTMNHALSMVSFRVYNDGSLAGDGLLTKVKIRNVETKTAFKAGETSTMSLKTGMITQVNSKDSVVRTLVNYTIPCAITEGTDKETMFKFIPSGSTVTGPKVARKMSMLVYPITEILEGELEVVFTIDGKEYPVTLPNTDVSSWIAGENQLYTVCASERKLTITSVEVTEWVDGTGGDIEL